MLKNGYFQRRMKIRTDIAVFFFLCLIFQNTVHAQSRMQFSGMSGTMLAHSTYNRNLDNRKSLGVQFSYLWDLSLDTLSTSKEISKKYVGISMYGIDMGDGFLNGDHTARKRLPAMGFATGGMIITGIQRKLQGVLGQSSLGLQFGFGPMLVSKYYDAVKNPANQAIGSRLNFGSQLKLQFTHLLSTHSAIGIGAEMFHVSNTNFQKPNVGLNYLQGNFSFIHLFHEKDAMKKNVRQSFSKKTAIARYQLSSRAAFRKFRMDYPVNYAVLVLEADYGFQKKYLAAKEHELMYKVPAIEWRAGLNYFYEMPRSVQTTDGKTLSLEARSELGLYGRALFRMGWVDIFVDLGYYLIPPKTDRIDLLQKNKYIYNAIGSQYRLAKNLFLIHRMKAHFQIADYLEMGLVYRL